jgi:hypothetical protein
VRAYLQVLFLNFGVGVSGGEAGQRSHKRNSWRFFYHLLLMEDQTHSATLTDLSERPEEDLFPRTNKRLVEQSGGDKN